MNGPRTPLDGLREAVLAAAARIAGAPGGASEEAGAEEEAGPGGGGPEPRGGGQRGGQERVTLERPPRVDFGDYSTNAALLLAPVLGAPPREVAEQLGGELQRRLGDDLERFEVAGPGFVNLFLADSWHRRALARVLEAGEGFGGERAERGERILVEFVSANPTGPMHVGHARNAAYGDALARLLALRGHEVTREFYVNDAGSQVRKLGESILALAKGEEVPEDGYHGDYVKRLAESLAGEAGDASAKSSSSSGGPSAKSHSSSGPSAVSSSAKSPLATSAIGLSSRDPSELGQAAVNVMVGEMQSSLQAFGVEAFDHWQFESELHAGEPSRVGHALAILEEQGHTYRSEGALWLRTTAYGDDKDRVLVRSTGEHTYFASDIAYHQDKRERGFERQIDIWGADHHGYVARMKAAYEALGGDAGHMEMLIMQLVHLVRRGERAQMSKRAGEFVTLDELVEEIGVDAARWFLLSRSHDTTIDLDLDLAREQSSENPVYYVQYAHARIASMLVKAGIARVAAALEQGTIADRPAGEEPLHPSERALIKRLLAFPGEVGEAAQRRAPHRITAYALQVAQDFTAFYRDCRVVGAEPAAVEYQRIALCVAARGTIARCLEDLLGVGAPREM